MKMDGQIYLSLYRLQKSKEKLGSQVDLIKDFKLLSFSSRAWEVLSVAKLGLLAHNILA